MKSTAVVVVVVVLLDLSLSMVFKFFPRKMIDDGCWVMSDGGGRGR